MGNLANSYSKDNFIYGIPVSEKKEGETPIYRHREVADKELHKVSCFKTKTTWEAVLNNIKIGKGDCRLCGWRKKINKDEYEKNFTWITYNEAKKKCEEFAKGAAYLNFSEKQTFEKEGDMRFLGIYSRNRVEWVLCYLASHSNSITPVPVYDTLGEVAIEHILNQTQLSTLVLEPKGFKKIIDMIKHKKTAKLKNIIAIEGEDFPDEIKELKELGMSIYTFEEICEKGRNEGKNIELTPCKPTDIAIICYTSGTTGKPKGAMMPHQNLMVEVEVIHSCGFYLRNNDVYFSFLPYAHIMECLILSVLLSNGNSFGIFSGDTRKLIEECQILKPTCMCAVPRIFQRIFEGINENVKKQSKINQKIFKKAIDLKINDWRKYGILHNIFWDNLIFKKVRNILGGRVRYMLVGSAPMDTYILDFLRCSLSCYITEGYGGTEGCAGTHLTNMYDSFSKHVGGVGYACEFKLVDVPELNYKSTDLDENGNWAPRGEICVRGPICFIGYINDEENTKITLDNDGFVHSGDIGTIIVSHGNALRVIDRVKNIFKLSQGEYVAPEKLENVLVKCKYINQIFIYGDSLKNYLIAIIVPKPKDTIEFLQSIGINANKENYKNYFDNNELKKEILKELEKMGKANDFKGFEIIKKIFLFKDEFTIENDLVTPTLKIKRHNAKKYFAKEIEDMYNSSL